MMEHDPVKRGGQNFLVTGGCGFIGSHLVEALVAAGATVTVFDNWVEGSPDNLAGVRDQVRLVCGDIRARKLLEQLISEVRPKVIFHLAANASVPVSVEDPLSDYEINATGTFLLLELVRKKCPASRVVIASSGAVYGEPSAFPISEDARLHPISPYGYSKIHAERAAEMYQQVFNLDVLGARLFNSYGPRMPRFVILDFLRKLANNPNRLEILGSGRQVRDFTYVADTVAGLIRIADRGKSGEFYNLASGISYSVDELAKAIIAKLGLSGVASIVHTGKSWPGDPQHWEVSIEKISRLGYSPTISLEEGLRRTIDWFETKVQTILSLARSV